jgi:hypothetical protein
LRGGRVSTLVKNEQVAALAVDSEALYWAHDRFRVYMGSDTSIRKVPLDGGAVTTLVSGPQVGFGSYTPAPLSNSLTLDATSVYWSAAGGLAKLTPK